MGEPIDLRTRSTTYRIAPTESRSGVRMLAWGPTASLPPTPRQPEVPAFDTNEDLLPHEYGVDGTRHVLESELLVHRCDGRSGALVRLDGEPKREHTCDGDALTARLTDKIGDLKIELTWRTSQHHDVVTRSATIRNDGDETVVLPRALTGAFNVHLPGGVNIDALAGGWCEEYTPTRIMLPRGTFRIGSRQGLVSHLWAPVVTVSDPVDPDRGCWSVALAWSGSWQLDVHATSRAGWVRICGGVDEESPITLGPGESFEAPDLLGLWAPDSDEAARAWHRYQRLELLRDTSAARRPITYNSWYATGFDVRVDQQLALARRAADLGCEMFVLDDGWFRGRHSDAAGLGDWEPDPAAFPDGLEPLIEGVHALGMRFGLWIEPEGVSPDSDLYRAHPDWIHRSPDREPVTIRNQYVLDLGNPSVEEWVLDTLRRLLGDGGIDHLKWDMNRPITDGGPPGDPHSLEWAIRHTHAYHRLLDAVRREFPHVTIEACSGGGGRIAAPVMARSDVVWPSDETGARDRLAIQHGFLTAFPAAVMSSWVTGLDGMRDTTPASLTYQFCVAMCGVLGLGADLTQWNETDDATARHLIARYKDVRNVIFHGDVQRHGQPHEHGYTVQFSSADDNRSVLFVFSTSDVTETVVVRPWVMSSGSHGEIDAVGGEARWSGEGLLVDIDASTGAAMLVLSP